jgi:hypothetical protein
MASIATAATQSIDQETAGKALDTVYRAVIQGIPKVSKPIDKFAEDYLEKHQTKREAANELVRWQLAKCGTSGFVTGLGGLLTLPVSIPANISSVLYVQIRMVAAIAYMGGYDVHSDQVQTLCYIALTGEAATDVVKQLGTKVGEKVLVNAIKKVPGETLVKINQRVGFRLLTKFGEKGVINLGKAVPVVGGVVGGAFDVVTTHLIARNALKIFLPKEEPSKVDILKAEIRIKDEKTPSN